MDLVNKIKNEIIKKISLKEKNDDINVSDYKNLNPIDDLPPDSEYIKALHYGINDPKIKNIALTGPYGSGKSSIINSYIKNYPREKAINISLANFCSSKEADINYLESAILKQLFYKVKAKDIPQSRFKKIEKVSFFKIYVTILLLNFTAFFIFSFMNPNKILYIITLFKVSAKYYHFSNDLVYKFTILSIFVLLFFVSWIIKIILTQYRVKDIKANKISISANDGEKIFDKTLDEILYFFQETRYEIVFLEDLDRFNNNDIFIRLRELNTLINNSNMIKNKVVFVYAIKDEIFVDEERTKFFDFIIPVIPFINSTNSDEMLKKLFAKEKNDDGSIKSLKYDISFRYINLVSPFIRNMRTLINVYNEFIIYSNLLKSNKLNSENLLSIILFKNLYPNDFSDLENEKGIVKKVFDVKKTIIDKLISDLKEKKKITEDKLDTIGKDILLDIKEVKSAMLAYLSDYKAGYYFSFNTDSYYYDDIMEDDFDISIFYRSTSFYINCQRHSDVRGDNLKEKLEKSGKNYLYRIECLKDSSKERKEVLRNEIEQYEKQIDEVNSYSLKYLLSSFEESQIILNEVKGKDLLIFLLRNGYINENYADYINYFHPNSITENEMSFIRRIRMHEFSEGFNFPLKNTAQICERIENFELKQKEALNFYLLDYLLNSSNDEKCKYFFEGFLLEDDPHMQFIKHYITRNQNVYQFLNLLCKYYTNFCYVILKKNIFIDHEKLDYLSLIFTCATVEDIKKMDINNCISNYVISNENILRDLNDIDYKILISIIKELDIKFTNVNFEDVDIKLVDYIFEHQHYLFNESILFSYFKVKYPNLLNNLSTANYTSILESNDQYLISYIDDNFEEYVKNIVLSLKENTKENKNTIKKIIEILIDQNVELCVQLLEKEDIIWNNFDELLSNGNDKKNRWWELCNVLLDNNKIATTWDNFYFYCDTFTLNDKLVQWVNKSIDSLISSKVNDDFENSNILENLITNDSISEEVFEKLIKNYRPSKFDYNLSDFNEIQISKMIEINYIPLSTKYFDQIKKINYNDSIEYLINQKNNFLKMIKEFNLSVEGITSLLKRNELDEEDKIKVLSKLDEDDVNEDIANIIRNMKQNIDKKYVDAAWNILTKDEKYELLLNQIDIFANDEISEKLNELDDVYRSLSENKRRHNVKLHDDINGYNQRLVAKLEEKGYLSSSKKEGDKLIAVVRKQ